MYYINKEDEIYLNLVMEYFPETIYSYQKQLIKNKEKFSLD